VLQFVAVNAMDTWQALKKGQLVKAAKHVFDKRNLISLKAVAEDFKWVTKV
jgi:hypothetical protein